jgi:uncharacterized protein (TIGR03067 family)
MKLSPLLLCLVCHVSIVYGAPKPPDATAEDHKKMQGEWIVASQEVNGKKSEPRKLALLKLTVAGDKFTSRDGADVLDESTFKVGANVRPRTIDLAFTAGPDRGKSVLGIYKMEAGMLTVCVADVGGARPKEFATKEGSGHMLFVFRRAKN